MRSETEYLLKRASEEARRALTTEVPEASQAHETLAICYSARAVALLDAQDQNLPASRRNAREAPKRDRARR